MTVCLLCSMAAVPFSRSVSFGDDGFCEMAIIAPIVYYRPECTEFLPPSFMHAQSRSWARPNHGSSVKPGCSPNARHRSPIFSTKPWFCGMSGLHFGSSFAFGLKSRYNLSMESTRYKEEEYEHRNDTWRWWTDRIGRGNSHFKSRPAR